MPLRMIAGSYKFAQEIQLKDRVAPLLYLSGFPKGAKRAKSKSSVKILRQPRNLPRMGMSLLPGESMADVGGNVVIRCGNSKVRTSGSLLAMSGLNVQGSSGIIQLATTTQSGTHGVSGRIEHLT